MKLKFLEKYGSTILTVISATGVVATGYFTAKATLKASKIIEGEDFDKLSKAEKFKKVAPHYILPATIGLITIGTEVGAHMLDQKQVAKVMLSYAMLKEYHDQYRQKNIEINGEEADEKVINELAAQHSERLYPKEMGMCPDVKRTFVEMISGDEFVAYERDVILAEYHINRNFMLRGSIAVSEFREFLGLPPKKDIWDKKGWSMDCDYYWLDFEHDALPDGRIGIYSMWSPVDGDTDGGYWFEAYDA